MKNIVLVHGSWYGAWCWDAVTPLLEKQGVRVSTPELPKGGDATLEAYVKQVASAIDERAVVVAHSMAGVVLSTLAERHPEKIEKSIYLAAYLLRDGESIFQLATSDADSRLGPHLRPDEKNGVIAVAAEGFATALASGCAPDQVERARVHSKPDPLAPLATPVHVGEAFARVPRVYIQTTADHAVSTSLQSRMLAATPTKTIALNSGHSPFLQDPAALVDAIVAAAR